jgi:very-short-patch-repair endonuclease
MNSEITSKKIIPSYLEKEYSKENTFAFNSLTAGSRKTVAWKCEKGHKWDARFSHRVNGSGCPYCAGRLPIKGETDLATINPNLSKQWNSAKNTLAPSDVTANSHQKVWWQCENNHEWEATVKNRNIGRGCPYCSKRKTTPGKDDFLSLHNQLLKEIHPTKNDAINLRELSEYSHKKVWWICENDHEWESSIGNRIKKEGYSSCPWCIGRPVAQKHKALLVSHPLYSEIDFSSITEEMLPITEGSGNITWICQKKHTWITSVYSRTQRNYGCPYCAGRLVIENETDLQTLNPELAKQWHPTKNLHLDIKNVKLNTNKKAWWVCEKEHEWEAYIYSRSQGSGCPKCSNIVSKAEKEISQMLIDAGLNVITSDKKVLKGKELDIYIPEKNFAIEFNGLYWHTEDAGKDRTYHFNKWQKCDEQGIQLMQIWEDEWNKNSSRILDSIKYKLGITTQKKIMARKCEIVSVSKGEAESFLEQHHVQGYSNGSYYLGLREKTSSKLVSVLVLKKEPGTEGKTLNIIRYATAASVTGGFTKLLKFAEENYRPEKFITFSDHCVSDGGLYKNNGFIADKELAPDYMYVVDRERKHKFGYRLVKFRNNPELTYVEGLTERELAKLNNLPRIWDAGKTRWVKTVD